MILGPAPLCLKCVRFHDDNDGHFTCDAFPEGIPEEIVLRGFNHNRPFPGDNGMHFVARVKFAVVGLEEAALSSFAQEVFGRISMGAADERFVSRMRMLTAEIDRIVSGLTPEDQKRVWKAFYRIADELLTRKRNS